MKPRSHGEKETIPAEVRRLADNVSRLVRDHLELAKWELRAEAKELAADIGMGSMAVPFLFAALLFLDGALAVGLGSWLGIGWALLVVGVLNLGLGATLGGFAMARLRARPPKMEATTEELGRNVEMLQAVRQESTARKRVQVWIPEAGPEEAFPPPPAPSALREAPGEESHPHI